MIEMVRRFLRQRFGSPLVVIALALIALLTAFQAVMTGAEAALGSGFLAILLIAAGSVSRDASGGTLQMILARPIRRTSYLFGRYLGALASFGVFLLATAGLSLLFAAILPRIAGSSASPSLPIPALVRGAAIGVLNAAFFTAILLFFSTFLRGYADVLAFIFLFLALRIVPEIAQSLRMPRLQHTVETIRSNVLPDVNWGSVLDGHGTLGEGVGRWVLALTLYLTLAAVIFSRREFSYATD